MILVTYNMYAAPDEHPQRVMHDLGIDYVHAVPQSIADCWHFWGCSNLPDPLPPFLAARDADPMRFIGYGLSEAVARRLSRQ